MPGTVVTFYSYKGGVGRSFTLANIAVLLARWGHRVLCVDWDLEAPGLDSYFKPMMNADPSGGVVDLVDDFLAGRVRPGAHTTRLRGVESLDVITAGRADADYAGRIQKIDWEDLYQQGFGDYLERCREQWTTEYDYVLLDSRTGISDIGGICTAHLPDRLVVLFTANVQSMRGAVEIAERADVARDLMPYDRPQLTVLPVLSRFDAREEYERSVEWRRICLEETKKLFGNWLDRETPPELMSRHLTLPYVSYWTFGEELPVMEEKRPTADQISFALETVAAVVAHDFDRTDLLAENRDAYVAAVRAEKRTFTHDVRVSTPRPTRALAAELMKHLGDLDVRPVLSLSGERSLLERTEDDARHLCLLVDGEVSRWQAAEVELFLHRTLGQDRRVIPVLTARTEPNTLPGYVGNLRFLQFDPSRGPAEVAQGLVDQLNGTTALVEPGKYDVAGALRQAAQARLRPLMWRLVDEIVAELQVAIGAGESGRAQELAEDLFLTVRKRSTDTESHFRVVAPPDTRAAIDWAVRTVEARAVRHSFRGFLDQ
ncbi:tyrosine-protein kinase family protein [Amycolatopsis pittospori]|uniref:tyrosine-protein kinase family protein n=1 Tax=Amycolatopsis pittospori TaxID=2749434 RepID=UPI0015F08110|nr:AAA family ATPase [Amycolatopsis pittospori]